MKLTPCYGFYSCSADVEVGGGVVLSFRTPSQSLAHTPAPSTAPGRATPCPCLTEGAVHTGVDGARNAGSEDSFCSQDLG